MIQSFIGGSFNVSDHPFLMFKRSSYRDFIITDLQTESDTGNKTERERLFICKFCKNIITSPKSLFEINGKYNQTFINPAGNTFTIGCFSTATGCINFGELTTEHTWFPGYSWCYSVCSLCHSHLGWFYTKENSSFYGLILIHLIENI